MQEKIRTMKNIHLLQTDKASRVLYNSTLKSFCIQKEIDGMFINDGKVSGADFWGLEKALNNRFQPQNIYITNDEHPKPNNFYFDFENQKVKKCETGYYNKGSKKIILTTDQDLIKDGVQEIDDKFLEWFVKNPSCEEVKVTTYHVKGCISGKLHYKIIIQKEESVDMKQTAVEFLIEMFDLTSDHYSIKGVINQAKELEKQQMKKVWSASYENMRKTFGTSNYTPIDFEDFWNKFKNE